MQTVFPRNAVMFALALLIASAQPGAAQQSASQFPWSEVDAAIGRAGQAQPDGTRRFSFPRSDLRVMLGSVQLKPALALGSWTSFLPLDGRNVLIMGDLVLEETEVGPVIAELQRGGIQQTAVHNHLVNESPKITYVHIHARGAAPAIARTVHAALRRTTTPLAPPPAAGDAPIELDTAAVALAIGRTGRVNGGVYQISVPRAEEIRDEGILVPASMGLATVINFQPTGNGKAAITGDFVMLPDEVNSVIGTLERNGIQVTALHTHLLHEQPHLFFMHFWANDDAQKLARGLRAALDQTKVKPATR
jgi:hypothetical protein